MDYAKAAQKSLGPGLIIHKVIDVNNGLKILRLDVVLEDEFEDKGTIQL